MMLRFLSWLDQISRTNSHKYLYNISSKLSHIYLKYRYRGLSNSLRFFYINEDKIWLLAQHLDDNNLQNTYLTFFKLYSRNLQNIAYLEDRTLVNTTGKQLYGTQYFEDGLYYYFYPIIGIKDNLELEQYDRTLLNIRRKKMNLEPIEDYANNIWVYEKKFLKFEIKNFNIYKN